MDGDARVRELREAATLAQLGAQCTRAGVTREVLLIRLSLIPERHFHPHYSRLVEAALERLGRADRARLYRLPSHDLALAWRSADAIASERRFPGPAPDRAPGIDLERITEEALGTLFSATSRPLPPFSDLIRRFRLPRDGPGLASLLRYETDATESGIPERRALDLAELGLIERALASADVSRFVHRTSIARAGKEGLEPVFERRFLALPEIGRCLAPGRDLGADPWLLRRLRRTLDRRLLALLGAPGELRGARALAFPCALGVVLAPAFLAFDRALAGTLRANISLEIDAADILPDPAAFLFARDFLASRGYRLILRAPELAPLAALPLEALGCDLVALTFSPSFSALPAQALASALPEPAKVVLYGRPASAVLERQLMRAWGEAHGIALFEVAPPALG